MNKAILRFFTILAKQNSEIFLCHFRAGEILQDQVNCISRSEEQIDFFSTQKKKHKRWNLFNQIKIEDGNMVCKHEYYKLNMTCMSERLDPTSYKCTLLDTNEIIDLNPAL